MPVISIIGSWIENLASSFLFGISYSWALLPCMNWMSLESTTHNAFTRVYTIKSWTSKEALIFLTRKHLFILFLVFVEKCVYCLLHWRHYLCNTCCVTHISSHINYLLRMEIQTQLYIIYDIIVVNTCFAINYINLFSVYKQVSTTRFIFYFQLCVALRRFWRKYVMMGKWNFDYGLIMENPMAYVINWKN